MGTLVENEISRITNENDKFVAMEDYENMDPNNQYIPACFPYFYQACYSPIRLPFSNRYQQGFCIYNNSHALTFQKSCIKGTDLIVETKKGIKKVYKNYNYSYESKKRYQRKQNYFTKTRYKENDANTQNEGHDQIKCTERNAICQKKLDNMQVENIRAKEEKSRNLIPSNLNKGCLSMGAAKHRALEGYKNKIDMLRDCKSEIDYAIL